MEYNLPSQVRIGHIHLKVSNIEKSLKFYQEILGFEVTSWYGNEAVFLSAGGYHHHIALNTWHSKGALPPPMGHTGLYHFALIYPTRRELALIVKRILQLNYPIVGASDHGVSESIYLEDPDGNGVELYADRPHYQWPLDDAGKLFMVTRPLDLVGLLSELDVEVE